MLRHVILPALTPVTVFLLLCQTINALQVFDLVYRDHQGRARSDPPRVIVYFIWEQAFKTFTAGYGAAAAYVLAVALLVTRRGRCSSYRRRRDAAKEQSDDFTPRPPARLERAGICVLRATGPAASRLPLVWSGWLSSVMSNAEINRFPPALWPHGDQPRRLPVRARATRCSRAGSPTR